MIAMLSLADVRAQETTNRKKRPKRVASVTRQTWDFSTVDHLLPLYVKAKMENNDFNSPLTGILVFYGGLDDAGKMELRKYLVDKMDGFYNEEKAMEALAIADIYESIAPTNDFGMLRLYYYRGEQAATQKGDSIALKQYMNHIAQLPDDGNDKKSDCLFALNSHLEAIRNYIPMDKTIDGMWVSDIRDLGYGNPFFILNIHTNGDGITTFTLTENSQYLGYASFSGDQAAQEKLLFTADSVYVAWSNEDMKNPSPELNYIFRQTTGFCAGELGTKIVKNGGVALQNITSGLIGLGMDAIADAIFTPSKHVFFLQAKMCKVNGCQIEADISSTKLYVKGDKEPKLTEDNWHTLFTKVENEDSLFWVNYMGKPFFVSELSEDLLADILEKVNRDGAEKQVVTELTEDMQRSIYKSFVKEDRKAIKKKYGISMLKPDKIKALNLMQYRKMCYKNEEKLIKQGETALSDIINLHNHNTIPMIGILFNDSTTIVSSVAKYSPADFAGVIKNDKVTHVDGYEVKTSEQIIRLIRRKKPYDTATLTIKRKKKVMEIPLEIDVYVLNQEEKTK